MSRDSAAELHARIRACTLCAGHLPLGPRPVVRFSPTARLLIAGQAPGRRVHETGIPFNGKNPWFEREVIPELRRHVARVLAG